MRPHAGSRARRAGPSAEHRGQILFWKPGSRHEGNRTDQAPLLFDEGVPEFTTAHDGLPYTPGTRAQFGGEGLVSTFEDYRRYCEMLLGKGVFRGRRVVSEQSIWEVQKQFRAAVYCALGNQGNGRRQVSTSRRPVG